MNKMMIKYVNDKQAQVSKSFAKKAVIFGTPEFNLWRAYLKEFPEAQMEVAPAKKNSGATKFRNMTYENMKAYIKAQKNADAIQAEFDRRMEMAKLQNSPYRYMVEWFQKTFENYTECEAFKTEPNETPTEEHPTLKVVNA